MNPRLSGDAGVMPGRKILNTELAQGGGNAGFSRPVQPARYGETHDGLVSEHLWGATAAVVRPLQFLFVAPSWLFLATLAVVLFRPPDYPFYSADHVVFVALVLAAALHVMVTRRPIPLVKAVSAPMLCLLVLAGARLLSQPFDAETWSLVAAKFVVPYTLFHLAILVFGEARAARRLEIFAVVVLAYLCFTALAFVAGARLLIFPRFILDESLGIHLDRARGPFLQAVANGVTLNLLGLVALDSFGRGRLRGWWGALLLAALPVAILATMTRAVWLSFAGSVVAVWWLNDNRRVRRVCLAWVIAGAMMAAVALSSETLRSTLQDRAVEEGPVEVRLSVYRAAWELIQERPLAGWGINRMPPELARRMEGYHLKAFWPHNTYLEILVEQGVLGLGLYVWLMVGVYRLGRPRAAGGDEFPGAGFRRLWPVILGVYLLNAMFVVMNYQFVNGLLFTLAGVLAAQNRRDEEAR